MQSAYVRGLTQNKVRTPLILFKNKKTRQTYRVGKDGMYLASDQKPLKDSINLIKTQKANKKPINYAKTSLKTLERLPSGKIPQ
jgi:hypothetical protein